MKLLKKIKPEIIIVLILFLFFSCVKKKLPLEEKVSLKKGTKVIAENTNLQKNKSENLEEETTSLNQNFQTSGRTNPFMPLGGAPQGATNTGTSSSTYTAGQPIYNTNQTQSADSKMTSTLPPLPNQTLETVDTPEVPQWPTQPPILSASPTYRLDSLVHLTLRGVIYPKKGGGKKLAIIEEKGGELKGVQNATARTSSGSSGGGVTTVAGPQNIVTRSYIVQENEFFTEYAIQVVKINSDSIVLKRGNQKITLSLKLTPSGDFIPYDVPTVASQVESSVKEGTVSASAVR